jgi:hypothetical protein
MSILNRLMGMLQGALLGTQQKMAGRFRGRNVKPASQDPYGDPADQMGMGRMGQRRHASPMPPGNGRFGNVKPASQDPYGDPADQMGGSWRR